MSGNTHRPGNLSPVFIGGGRINVVRDRELEAVFVETFVVSIPVSVRILELVLSSESDLEGAHSGESGLRVIVPVIDSDSDAGTPRDRDKDSVATEASRFTIRPLFLLFEAMSFNSVSFGGENSC